MSAVVGVVIGNAVDMAQEPPARRCATAPWIATSTSHRWAQSWRALDPAEFPFVHDLIEEFDGHDDVDQFRAAPRLTRSGLRLQAGT